MTNSSRIVSGVTACAVAFALAFALTTDITAAEKPSAREHVVEITGFKFVPESIDAKPGDTITWVNLDIAPHTATGTDGSWDTGTLRQNESKSLTMSPGMTPDYLCKFHVNMTGVVVTDET